MGKNLCVVLLAVLTVFVAGVSVRILAQPPTPKPQAQKQAQKEEEEKERGESAQIERRQEWFFSTRRGGTDTDTDMARLRNAGVEATRRSLEVQRLARSRGVASPQSSWVSKGPSASTFGDYAFGNVAGRVTSLAGDWARGVLYVGTAAGGLWKSTDDGLSWTSLFDSAGTQTVGTVAIDPNDPNVIWVGTGENQPAYGCESYFGIGLLRSADGGMTWEVRNGSGINTLEDLASFANVVIDPRDSNRIVTGGGTRGCSMGSTLNGGLYTSNDGGLTWVTRIPDTRIFEIARNPAALDILWAGTNRGVYKSTDNGVTWVLQTSSGLPNGETGRTQLAIAPSDGNTVYALFESGSFWRTNNGGVTWTQTSSGTDGCDGQCFYNMVLRVDPSDPNTVYRGTIHLFRSQNGGSSWSDLSGAWGPTQKVHQDTHELLIHPTKAGTFYVGSDGGVWKTVDGGNSFSNLNGNLNVTQLYAVGVDAANPDVICGGAQDNSSLVRTTSDVWTLQEVTGDGFLCHLDPLDANYAYVASYPNYGYPSIYRSSTGVLGPFGTVTVPGSGVHSGDRVNWVTPYLLDPTNPATLYLGTHRVYRSTDHGTNWLQVGPADLTGGGSATLIALELNRTYPTYLFSGSTDGRVWRSVDRGSSWTNISTGLPASRSINDIAGDPTNPDRAFAVVGGFNTAHLWEWTSAGGWIARGTGLPNVPANSVLMLTDSDILVGTDTGIFRSRDAGVTFQPFMDGLPEGLVVTDLKFNAIQSVVTAGTYGRGAWQIGVDVDMPPVVHYHAFDSALVQVSGDGDGDLERGETWSIRPILKNDGGESALGVQARLEAASAGVTILDGGPRPYGDFAPGATSAPTSGYSFTLDPASCSSDIAFRVAGITSTNAPGAYPDTAETFTVRTACPNPHYDGFANLTQVEGNGNDGIDPGETWELTVSLRNDGYVPALGVTADLSPDPASAGSVTLLQSTSAYGDIPVGAAKSSVQTYRFQVNNTAPCGEWISLDLVARTADPAVAYPKEVGVIRLLVGGTGPAVRLFYDDFESPRGWWLNTDNSDWQIDVPRGLGTPLPDPTSGFAGPRVLGNDLTGLGAVPGNYENWTTVKSAAVSPEFDFSQLKHVTVSFARWLNVGAGDTGVFQALRLGPDGLWAVDTLFSSTTAADSSWQSESFDVSSFVAGWNSVVFQFELDMDSQGTASGWNVDAFEVRGVPPESCEPYVPAVVRYDSYTGPTEVEGNGNGIVDPGETWEVAVRLRNDGPVPLNGVSARLSVDAATPGSVVLLQDHSDFGTIAPGQVASSLQTYRFKVGDGFPCGGRIVFSVSGIASTSPLATYPNEVGVIRVPVGQDNATTLYTDGFEPRGPSGPFWQTEGEWQIDKPHGLGSPQADPSSAYQGQYVLGTDLTGLGANPGNYENGVSSSAYSPVIPVAGLYPTGIRFAHWTNLASGDYMTMRVTSDVPGDSTTAMWAPRTESSWTVDTFGIGNMAPNKSSIQVQFLLQSDAQSTSSGWNMDAFQVLGGVCQPYQALPGEASSLHVNKTSPAQLALDWSADCGGATAYSIYRGDLSAGYGSIALEPGMCDVAGTSATVPLGSGNAEFFLVVPNKNGAEGSYGRGVSGAARPPAATGCYPQGSVAACVP